MDGHQVLRLLEAIAHRVLATAARIAEIGEALLAKSGALPVAILAVGYHRCRGHAVVEPGRIDERLDGRARLPLGLRSAVERAEPRIEAALHRQHAAGMRVLRDEAARHFGYGADRITVAGGRGGNDVTLFQGVGQVGQRRFRTIGKTDRRRIAAALRDDAHAPVLVIDREIGAGQLARPAAVVEIDRCNRPMPSVIAVISHQAVTQGVTRGILQFNVERSADPQTARIDAVGPILGLLAIFVDQLAAHFFKEIAGIG